jgi:DNA-binding NtrC family response regulator
MTRHPIASILIVEDDPRQLRLYSRILRGYRVTCVSTATAALEELAGQPPDLVILDHVLAGGERGAEFLPRLKSIAAHVPVVMISGTLDLKAQLAALQGPDSAHYVLEKPVDPDELERVVRTAIDECGLGETVRSLQSLERAEKIEDTEPERRFTERLSRQHDLVKRLRGAEGRPNISLLARDYRVSRRTILRDLHDLIQRGQLDPGVCPEPSPENQEDP